MKNVMLELTRIVQQVSLLETAAEQVVAIVDAISQVIGVDVCSLYRASANGDMQLLASHGLTSTHPVTIPAGMGLVGLVARSRHTLNLDEASNHPDYYYVAESGEERFHSFCGVPLVRSGQVIGVLVVQSCKPVKLNDEYEAFLATLAAHLVFIVAEIESFDGREGDSNILLSGVPGAPGVSIGNARLCESEKLGDVAETWCENIEDELKQWEQLLKETNQSILEEQQSLGKQVSGEVTGVFDAYKMLLADQALTSRVAKEIASGLSLPSALKISVHYFSELFHAMDDPYLKARGEDIYHLGNKLYQVWRGEHPQAHKNAQRGDQQGIILVGSQVSVSDIAAMAPGQLAGILSFAGSALSHTAVLANALGVPAVMGVGETHGIAPGDQLILDGNAGLVYLLPGETLLDEYQQVISKNISLTKQLEALRELPAETTDGERVRLLTNTGLLADIMPGLWNGAEGVGLYRTEIPFMVRQGFPTEDEQVEDYSRVFKAYEGKPVYVRTLDIGGDKQLPYFPIRDEENPAMGWRGIRFCLDNVQLLMTQVRAIIRAAVGHEQLHILLPMVSSTQEIQAFRQLLDDACQQLEQEGIEGTRPKVGVMVEVPAAIPQLVFWKEQIDFISIGSNDLSQYLLALDRNNSRVASRYDHVHPAVLQEINRIVQSANLAGLPVSLCGEMASDPVAVMYLIGIGMRTLSMSSTKLPRIKWLIRSITLPTAQHFAAEALKLDNVKAIRQLGAEYLYTIGLQELLN